MQTSFPKSDKSYRLFVEETRVCLISLYRAAALTVLHQPVDMQAILKAGRVEMMLWAMENLNIDPKVAQDAYEHITKPLWDKHCAVSKTDY